jgi:MFS superfamily sulfate permease-like transporter
LINIDATIMDMLENVRQTLQDRDRRLINSAPNQQPLDLIRRSGFLHRFGRENCVDDQLEAILIAA